MSDKLFAFPDSAPFDASQRAALARLLAEFSSAQSAWLSGYLAGISAAVPVVGPAPEAASSQPLTILFGSESGNAESCATAAAKAAKAAGFHALVADMGDYDVKRLAAEQNLLIVVSTWGEGDPPDRAADFHAFVHGSDAPRLPGLRYAVCALGDTSYPDFCACGIQFDEQLEKLGARRIHPRVDCDVDFEEPFQRWLQGAIEQLSTVAIATRPVARVVDVPASTASVEPYGKNNPFSATLLTKINLNGTGSAKETHHLEFSLEGSGITFEPGDVVGVIPCNCPEEVDELLMLAGFSGNEAAVFNGESHCLRDVLIEHYDVNSLNAMVMKKYAALTGNPALEDFLKPENKDALSSWLSGREILDLFHGFAASKRLSVEQFLSLLRKMPPRLYSIASSLLAYPDQVHLTVGVVRYESHGRMRKGVCSTFLSDRVEVGDKVALYTHANKNFSLPEDGDVPIIMVGPGTGIAPYRAFLQERQIRGCKGKNWLFFGDQHFNTDFLYQTEWQDYLKSGLLTRMDVAFSRDTDQKIYVQHRMKEKARDVYAWMQEGACFYVCGDAIHMAKDVHQTLIEIYAQQGGMSMEAAETQVKHLQKQKFYQKDVY